MSRNTRSSSAKIPQIGAFPDHRGVAAYSHLQDFGGDSDKSLCFPTTISFVYFLPPRAVIHCESEVWDASKTDSEAGSRRNGHVPQCALSRMPVWKPINS